MIFPENLRRQTAPYAVKTSLQARLTLITRKALYRRAFRHVSFGTSLLFGRQFNHNSLHPILHPLPHKLLRPGKTGAEPALGMDVEEKLSGDKSSLYKLVDSDMISKIS